MRVREGVGTAVSAAEELRRAVQDALDRGLVTATADGLDVVLRLSPEQARDLADVLYVAGAA